MGFLKSFPLSLFLFTSSYFLPISSTGDECEWLAQAAETQNLGAVGQAGKTGKNGENGKNSDNLTIFADGIPVNLNLSGQNGNSGENGEAGKDSNCPEQPQNINRNLQGANGGNGGDGGDGGNGGDGGALTIYSTDVSFLRQMTINASGGKGGQPGPGGAGSQGCHCQQPYWTNQTCKGRPGDANYSCTTQEFRCQDGLNGKDGTQGRVGKDGRNGKLTLINFDRPLTPDQPSSTVAMQELKDRGVILSKNIWETRKGAVALFAPGSVIEDQYLALQERIEKSFLLIWNAPQPFNSFATRRVTLGLDEQNNIQVTVPDKVWLQSSTQKKGNVTELVIYNAILEEDVTRLKSDGISGSGPNLELFILDNGGQSSLIATEFQIKYRVTRAGSDSSTINSGDYSTRYEGKIPPELVTFDGNQFTIALGQLPIAPEFLKIGTRIEIELTATRSFANYSKQQVLVLQETIKSSRRK